MRHNSEITTQRPLPDSPRQPSRARHQQHCTVCRHPDRQAIEELFLHRFNPEDIAHCYPIPDPSNLFTLTAHALSSLPLNIEGSTGKNLLSASSAPLFPAPLQALQKPSRTQFYPQQANRQTRPQMTERKGDGNFYPQQIRTFLERKRRGRLCERPIHPRPQTNHRSRFTTHCCTVEGPLATRPLGCRSCGLRLHRNWLVKNQILTATETQSREELTYRKQTAETKLDRNRFHFVAISQKTRKGEKKEKEEKIERLTAKAVCRVPPAAPTTQMIWQLPGGRRLGYNPGSQSAPVGGDQR